MTTHELKVHPQHFAALADNSKPFEARKDDRDPPFAVGDTLRLREWDPEVYDWECAVPVFALPSSATLYEVFEKLRAKATEAAYTGRTLERRVTYVLRGGPWLAEGYVVLGLEMNYQALMRSRHEALLRRPASADTEEMARALFKCSESYHALFNQHSRIAAALGAGADSDLVSLATTLAAFYAAHAETVDRQRDALHELVTLKDEHPLDYEARKAAAWDAARRALEGGE